MPPTTTRVISCKSCGGPYETKRSNTKYCAACRLLLDVEYIHGKTKKCYGCDQRFALLDSNEALCPVCAIDQHSRYGAGECKLCKNERPYVRPGVPVCSRCAHDSGKRDLLRKALAKGRRARQLASERGTEVGVA